jgi:hypothetical protein
VENAQINGLQRVLVHEYPAQEKNDCAGKFYDESHFEDIYDHAKDIPVLFHHILQHATLPQCKATE